MAVQEIIELGNPILREKSTEIDNVLSPETQQIITDLMDTLNSSPVPGVWIAAPQIWINQRVLIIYSRPTPNYPDLEVRWPEALINPVIVSHNEELEEGREWCLSIPGIRGIVTRYTSMSIEYTDKDNNKQKRDLTWFTARIFQHEYDHLEWVMFTDRVKDKKWLMTLSEFTKRILKK